MTHVTVRVMSEMMKERGKPCHAKHDRSRSFWYPGSGTGSGSHAQWICLDCAAAATARRRTKVRATDADAHRALHAAQAREHGHRLRMAVIAAYGGVCRCCGEDDWRKLTVDHIDGSGNVARRRPNSKGGRTAGGGVRLYSQLRREGYPTENYQLLCWSCNAVKYYFPDDPCCEAQRRSQVRANRYRKTKPRRQCARCGGLIPGDCRKRYCSPACRHAAIIGTANGYNFHHARGETPCPPCREAATTSGRAGHQRRRAALIT